MLYSWGIGGENHWSIPNLARYSQLQVIRGVVWYFCQDRSLLFHVRPSFLLHEDHRGRPQVCGRTRAGRRRGPEEGPRRKILAHEAGFQTKGDPIDFAGYFVIFIHQTDGLGF